MNAEGDERKRPYDQSDSPHSSSHFVAEQYPTCSEEPLAGTDFIEASKFCRGLVGVVEVPGIVSVGDSVTVAPEVLPKWLR